jgi:hypothetical protein
MGYPMTWDRVLMRNNLLGNYTHVRNNTGICDGPGWLSDDAIQRLRMLSGDLRRLERDSVDGDYATKKIATAAGVDIETVKKVLIAFFTDAGYFTLPTLPIHDEM